jgi:cytidylate kinase
MGLFATRKSEDKTAAMWSVNSTNQKRFNITVASWPGVGSTTLGLILSYIYNLKYFYSGNVFRYFSEKLGYAAEGKTYNRNEDKYGKYLDTLVDDYSKLLLEKGGYLVGTKPLGYIIDRDDTFRIFLYASMKARIERSVKDGRESKDTIEEGLKMRQKVAGDRYKRLYGFDWEDMKVLKASHELVLDTTSMQISEEIILISKTIKEEMGIDTKQSFIFGDLGPTEIKKKAQSLIDEKSLELDTTQAVREMYSHFEEEINKKPQNIIDVFKNA